MAANSQIVIITSLCISNEWIGFRHFFLDTAAAIPPATSPIAVAAMPRPMTPSTIQGPKKKGGDNVSDAFKTLTNGFSIPFSHVSRSHDIVILGETKTQSV